MAFSLHYSSATPFDRTLPPGTHVLGVIGFGADRPSALPAHLPFARVEIARTDGTPCWEIWTAAAAPVPSVRHGITCAATDGVLFGVLAVPQAETGLRELARRSYARIFACLADQPQLRLLRLWNYLPRITAAEDGAERYRLFNAGRQDAFLASGFDGPPPAASALGGRDGDLVIYFLATPQGGIPVENPRQVSAYRYPPQYGASPPLFSRASLGASGLFISGTASILGHQSMHSGDLAAQTAETIRNLQAVIAEAARQDPAAAEKPARFKAYIRHAADAALVETSLRTAFPAAEILPLQADICREELLAEVEAAFL